MSVQARKITVSENPQQQITVPREPSNVILEDPWNLRDIGLQHIRSLAGKIWTDHNIHDPGRTILESLCYSISDLAYRTDYLTKDILTEKPVNDGLLPKNQFFTAREILSSSPVTDEDFRKVMIDCDGVKNAWISSADKGEVPIYIDVEKVELTTKKPSEIKPENTIKLRGLNNIYLELDHDIEFGDLNSNILNKTIEVKSNDENILLDLDIGFGGLFNPAIINGATNSDFKLKQDSPYLHYQADWSLNNEDWNWQNISEIKDFKIHEPLLWLKKDILLPIGLTVKIDNKNHFFGIILHISDRRMINMQAPKIYKALIKAIKNDALILQRLFGFYQNKVERRLSIVKKVLNRLHDNRPLAEDYLKINGTKIEEIAVCSDIEIASEAETQKVYADIFFQIEKFLSPDIQFYSLENLLEKNQDPTDIFNGPALDHGFIDNEELKNNKRLDCVHLSDLIDIIMDVEHVVAVKSLRLASFIDNENISKDRHWVLQLKGDALHVPRLSLRKSSFNFFKGVLPSAIDRDDLGAYYEELQARQQRNKLAADVYDLEIPKGEYRNLEEYTSIQHHFPLNYGIGPIGIAEDETDERKAQAKQLKSYLMFFDQVLANYLSQLSHTKNLLSVNAIPKYAYAVQPLYEVPEVATLFTDFVKTVKKDINLKNVNEVKNAWNTYIETDNGYQKNLQLLTDNPVKCDRRRNLFLDHLLARFSEQFSDYAVLLNDLEGRRKSDKDLIEDKRNFLQKYPKISSERGVGFNHYDSVKSWSTDNVSGLAARVSSLVGIAESSNPTLAPLPKNNVKFIKDSSNKWRFKITIPAKDGVSAFAIETSVKNDGYDSKEKAQSSFFLFLELVAAANHARVEKLDNGKFQIRVRKSDGEYLADSKKTYSQKSDAFKAFDVLQKLLEKDYFVEGMHIVEHILLRPFNNGYELMPIVLDKKCNTPPELVDPYSYRISVILPALAKRFRNQNMRHYVEKTLRMEAPAHVTLKVCWVNYEDLWGFERAYKPWLKSMSISPNEPKKMHTEHKDLMSALNEMRSIYPEAILHDCENPNEDLNPVVLGYTSLGTFIEFDPEHED